MNLEISSVVEYTKSLHKLWAKILLSSLTTAEDIIVLILAFLKMCNFQLQLNFHVAL